MKNVRELVVIARKLFFILKEEKDLWGEMLEAFDKITSRADFEKIQEVDPNFTETFLNLKIQIKTFIAHKDIVLDEASKVIDENDPDEFKIEIEGGS